MSSIIPESLPEFLLGTLSAFIALMGLSNGRFNRFENKLMLAMEELKKENKDDRDRLVREMDRKYASLEAIVEINQSLTIIKKDLEYITKDMKAKIPQI